MTCQTLLRRFFVRGAKNSRRSCGRVLDPTTLNRQGNDVGTQYRSAIFYADDVQKREAEGAIEELGEQKAFEKPIVTQVLPQTTFYKAEGYHQNYFNNNAYQPYCQFVVWPKVEKFEKYFAAKMKAEAS